MRALTHVQTLAAVPTLAQAGGFASILFWGVVLIVALGVLFAVAAGVRRWMRTDLPRGPVEGFTLGDLRQLVKEGKMTAEQYERAKAKIVERAHERGKAAAEPEPQPKPDVRQ